MWPAARPAGLLLHGYPQNLAMWARVAPMLARKFTVVCARSARVRRFVQAEGRCRFVQLFISRDGGGSGRAHEECSASAIPRASVTTAAGAPRIAWRSITPARCCSLAVLDIVPTYAMFMDTNRQRARAYWHWYFLSQPAPFPEHMIGKDPDFFFETCLVGWGATRVEDFDA